MMNGLSLHPKRSSFVAWILNYLYELTLTLNARNRNQKESGREQDSCRTRNQDFVAPALYHMPIEVVSVRVTRAPALGENAFWSCVLENCGRETEVYRSTDQISKSLSKWSDWRANHIILQGKNDSSIQLDNSSRRLPFCGGILQFWTPTDQERPESTIE